MSVTPKRLEPENALRINEATAYPRIDAAQYYRDTANANAINRLSFAAIGRRYDGEIYYTIKGTYISLLEDPPLLQQMGCSDTSALTSIIAPLNTWLQSRAEIIQSGKNSESGLAASDEKIRDLGLEHVRHALLNLSTSRKRTLLIEDMRENGGTLLIPPRALLILPQAREIIVNSDVETVKSISFLTEMITPAGAACMLNSTTVFEGVKAGTAVRLQRPRKISLQDSETMDIDVAECTNHAHIETENNSYDFLAHLVDHLKLGDKIQVSDIGPTEMRRCIYAKSAAPLEAPATPDLFD